VLSYGVSVDGVFLAIGLDIMEPAGSRSTFLYLRHPNDERRLFVSFLFLSSKYSLVRVYSSTIHTRFLLDIFVAQNNKTYVHLISDKMAAALRFELKL
jgi:hypothetical protein